MHGRKEPGFFLMLLVIVTAIDTSLFLWLHVCMVGPLEGGWG